MAFLFFAYCSMLIRNSLLVLALWLSCTANGQTAQQWAQTVHWDGVTHWSRYINMLPAKMGPNALPIPYLTNGSVDNDDWVSGSLQLHSRPGEKAQSIVLNGNISLVKDLIAFNLSYIPAEFYTMSDSLKRERHVYYEFWNDKKARGDLLMNVNIKLLKKWEKNIQLALRIGYRYPSSNGFASSRFTDNMGYWFDVSAGKPLGHSGFKWIGMLGFYCWQIDRNDLRQDDAFLFGTGLEYRKNNWKWETSFSGYLGYLEKEGDKPMVFRSSLEKKFSKNAGLLKFQQGTHDYKYTTVEAGYRRYF